MRSIVGSAILCAAIMLLATASNSVPAGAVSTVQVRTIPIHAIVSDTAIFSHSLFWTQAPPQHGNLMPESLYWSNLAQIVPHRVFTFPSGTTVLSLQVSADWIAADLSGTRGSSVWVMNRVTHQPHTVAFRPIAGSSTLQGFTLLGDSLAFVDENSPNNTGHVPDPRDQPAQWPGSCCLCPPTFVRQP